MREFFVLAFLTLSSVGADAACTFVAPDNKAYSVAIGATVCLSTGSSEGALMRCVAQGTGVGFEYVRRCPLAVAPTVPSSKEKPFRDGDIHPFWNCNSSSRTGASTYDDQLLFECLAGVLSPSQFQSFRICAESGNYYDRCYDMARLVP
jgi:hypothetical protein